MKILRKVYKFELIQYKNLFSVCNDINMLMWIDENKKNELLKSSNNNFKLECYKLLR